MSNRRGSVDYPLRGTGRARNVHVSRRGSGFGVRRNDTSKISRRKKRKCGLSRTSGEEEDEYA